MDTTETNTKSKSSSSSLRILYRFRQSFSGIKKGNNIKGKRTNNSKLNTCMFNSIYSFQQKEDTLHQLKEEFEKIKLQKSSNQKKFLNRDISSTQAIIKESNNPEKIYLALVETNKAKRLKQINDKFYDVHKEFFCVMCTDENDCVHCISKRKVKFNKEINIIYCKRSSNTKQ